MLKVIIVMLLNLLIISCKNNNKTENWNYENVIEIGKTKDTTYIWCSITPYEDKYSYRIGNWEFRTEDSLKIANGTYNVFMNEIWDKGGCPYEYLENSIDLNKWEFWNSKGQKIKPTKKMLELVDYKVKEIEVAE